MAKASITVSVGPAGATWTVPAGKYFIGSARSTHLTNGVQVMNATLAGPTVEVGLLQAINAGNLNTEIKGITANAGEVFSAAGANATTGFTLNGFIYDV